MCVKVKIVSYAFDRLNKEREPLSFLSEEKKKKTYAIGRENCVTLLLLLRLRLLQQMIYILNFKVIVNRIVQRASKLNSECHSWHISVLFTVVVVCRKFKSIKCINLETFWVCVCVHLCLFCLIFFFYCFHIFSTMYANRHTVVMKTFHIEEIKTAFTILGWYTLKCFLQYPG